MQNYSSKNAELFCMQNYFDQKRRLFDRKLAGLIIVNSSDLSDKLLPDFLTNFFNRQKMTPKDGEGRGSQKIIYSRIIYR